ncbi:hypothetical protein BSKO_04789 [Bryopsis sp. KO-2023]|nr:hypothetical protein BSKO_04789 [Bryopsis sp. KO-2023]
MGSNTRTNTILLNTTIKKDAPTPKRFECNGGGSQQNLNTPLASPLKEWLFTIPCLLVSGILTAAVYVGSCLWLLQLLGVPVLKRANRFCVMLLVGHILAAKTLFVKYFRRPKVVFVCYPPLRMWEHVEPMLRSVRWFWTERQFVISDLAWDGKNVGCVCLIPPISTMADAPEKIQYHLNYCLNAFKGAKLALAGQLPSVARTLGVPAILHGDIVNGRVGTAALARRGVQKGIEVLRMRRPAKRPDGDLKLCILGGGGYTGVEISGACSGLFSEIYLVDKKYDGGSPHIMRREDGTVIMGTFDPCRVRTADIVLVFLPNGEMVEPYVEYAHKDQVWIDDTHPPIPRALRDELLKSSHLTRLTAVSNKMNMWPPLPSWKPQDLPGCLLTAVTVALSSKKTQEIKAGASLSEAKLGKAGVLEFIDLAEDMGVEMSIFPVENDDSFTTMGVQMDRMLVGNDDLDGKKNKGL